MFHHATSPPDCHGASSPEPTHDHAQAEESSPPDARVRTDSHPGVRSSRPRLLLVDDAPDLLFMLATYFMLSGYDVETAASAPEAIAAARGERFDAVVSDIGMPAASGYDLAAALREMPEYRGVPLVAVTGFDQYDDAERARRAGFDAHLKKPFEPAELLEVVRGLL